MAPAELLAEFVDAGLTLTPRSDGALHVSPAGALTDEHRQAIRAHKVELLALLTEPANDPTTAPANDPGPDHDPDRWCWPHSDAMNGAEIAEIALFLERVQHFTRRGTPEAEAEAERLADELVRADRRPQQAGAPSSATPTAPARPATRSCAACTHLTRRGTCLEPVGAGLAQTFGIRWPERGHAARCAAFMPSPAR